MMRKEFYQPWDQVMHVNKFGKQLNKEQAYLKMYGINTDGDVKTQFYVEQMIDSGIFSKQDIILWESDLQGKDWADALLFFESSTENEDTYTAVLGGTTKRTRFESAQNTAEECRDEHEEQREQEITNNERMQAYIGSFADASAAKEEGIQQMQDAASSKDSKMAEIIAKMEARDEARDE